MILDTLIARIGGRANLSPFSIASNTLLTHAEKLELLNHLKAEAAGQLANADHIGFSPEEIDAAIEQVRAMSQNDVGGQTVWDTIGRRPKTP